MGGARGGGVYAAAWKRVGGAHRKLLVGIEEVFISIEEALWANDCCVNVKALVRLAQEHEMLGRWQRQCGAPGSVW